MENIKVTGMSCSHCVATVTKTLEELGMTNVKVSLEEGKADFENPANVEKSKILAEIEEVGYEAE